MSWPRVSHPSVARDEIDLALYQLLRKIFVRSAHLLAYVLRCTVDAMAQRVRRMAQSGSDDLSFYKRKMI
jgi:hypothetical protein